MKILANAAYSVVDTIFEQYPQLTEYFGWLNTPRCCYSFSRLATYGVPIACDNSAYSAFCERRYLNMLHRISVPVLWVTVPDAVGNAHKTQDLWEEWHKKVCYPRAYVGQDGCETLKLPWHQFDCFFHRWHDRLEAKSERSGCCENSKTKRKIPSHGTSQFPKTATVCLRAWV